VPLRNIGKSLPDTRCHIHEDSNADRNRLEDVNFIKDGLKGLARFMTRVLCTLHSSLLSGPLLFTLCIIIFTHMSLFILEYCCLSKFFQLFTPCIIRFTHLSLFILEYCCLSKFFQLFTPCIIRFTHLSLFTLE
jgi:hypothetical protein